MTTTDPDPTDPYWKHHEGQRISELCFCGAAIYSDKLGANPD